MRLVFVDWVDSVETTRWTHFDDFPEPTPCDWRTVGWVLHDTESLLAVVGPKL